MSDQGVMDKDDLSRRDFLKLLAAGGVAMAFTPFIQWGKFMPNPDTVSPKKAQVVLSDGTFANLKTFPINHQELITYPATGDTVLDQEAFRKWNLIRLPEDLGGSVNDVTAFRVYSVICLHLWCMWKYKPAGEIGGNNKDNVHVMVACMIQFLEKPLQALHRFKLLRQIRFQRYILRQTVLTTCG